MFHRNMLIQLFEGYLHLLTHSQSLYSLVWVFSDCKKVLKYTQSKGFEARQCLKWLIMEGYSEIQVDPTSSNTTV